MSQYKKQGAGQLKRSTNLFYRSGINSLLSRLEKLEHQIFCCSDDTDAVVDVTDETYFVNAKTQDGAYFTMNRAGGIRINLPEATAANVGFNCTIAVKTAFTGTFIISCGSSSDLLIGGVTIVDPETAGDTNFFQPDVSDDDQLVANLDTKGRLAGGVVRIKIVAANRVLIEGTLVGDGTAVQPFA